MSMIDEKLYRETFSRLQASKDAKQEVFMKIQEQNPKRRLPKVLRGAILAAVLVTALAVTASATENDLLGFIEFRLTTIFDDGFHSVAVDEEGNEWNSYNLSATSELRDGRLYLKAMNQEVDITEDLEEDGEATYTFHQDDYDLTVTVTGTLEEHYFFSSSEAAGIRASDGRVSSGLVGADLITDEDAPGVIFIEKGTDFQEGEPFSYSYYTED